MKLLYTVPGKLKVSLVLTGLIAFMLFNNILERSQSRELKTAFESIYKDRLIAESYILQLSGEMHSIQNILDNSNSVPVGFFATHLQKINSINKSYLETQLTEEEKKHFTAFEDQTLKIGLGLKAGQNVETQIHAALGELKILSQIQVKEGAVLINETGKIFSSDAAHSQLEIVLLIVAGLMIQAILFASKTLQPHSKPTSAQLN
jgi:hypothetical protein